MPRASSCSFGKVARRGRVASGSSSEVTPRGRVASGSFGEVARRGRVAARRVSFALAALACLCVTGRAKSAENAPARGGGDTAEKKTIVLIAEEKGWERGPPLKVILRGGVRIEYDGLRL
ncbi:MAG: hypothetical protein ACYSU0_16930, partial [Planctomycetota bacterium]